jgi:hypothetical protein
MSLRVYNVTRKIYLKPRQAATAVDVCSAVWVQVGVSIRDVKDMAEVIALRNQRAVEVKAADAADDNPDRMNSDEILGCVYVPSLGNVESHRRERMHSMLTRRVMGAREHVPFVKLCQTVAR